MNGGCGAAGVPGAASATLMMLLADARLPAGAHVSSNSVEAGLRQDLTPAEVAAISGLERGRMKDRDPLSHEEM